jgi:ATP-dependent Clp protease ATP-binding subunit ClpX
LTFDDDVYDYIVGVAIDYGLGARGLRSVCEAILTDHMFDAPGLKEKELHINIEYAKAQIDRSSLRKIPA